MYKIQTWLRQTLLITACIIFIGATMSLPAAAASTKNNKNTTSSSSSTGSQTNISGSVTQSYNATSSVEVGMLVQLEPHVPGTVEPLSSKNISDMLGVVVTPNNATIVLTPSQVTQQQVLVATSGRYDVLVSNQNGPINVGDYITISAIDGVGMMANAGEDEVVGKAAGQFTGSSDVIGQVSLQSTLGKGTTVSIGRIPVDINIAHNPLFSRAADYVPSFLAKVATGIANKPVSSARIYLSMVILIITAMLCGNMLYSGIRGGMQAVGRNPLSRKSIIKSLIETVIAGLIIFVVGVLAVYLLLKL